MINKIPILGWLLSLVAATSLAVPFWICWTTCNIGKTYFYFLPTVYQSIPFWNCVGLFMSLAIIGGFIQKITPKIVSVSSSSSTN